MKCTTCGNRIFLDTLRYTLTDHLAEENKELLFCSKKCVKIYCVRKL